MYIDSFQSVVHDFIHIWYSNLVGSIDFSFLCDTDFKYQGFIVSNEMEDDIEWYVGKNLK
jgi:hypothetical protein